MDLCIQAVVPVIGSPSLIVLAFEPVDSRANCTLCILVELALLAASAADLDLRIPYLTWYRLIIGSIKVRVIKFDERSRSCMGRCGVPLLYKKTVLLLVRFKSLRKINRRRDIRTIKLLGVWNSTSKVPTTPSPTSDRSEKLF